MVGEGHAPSESCCLSSGCRAVGRLVTLSVGRAKQAEPAGTGRPQRCRRDGGGTRTWPAAGCFSAHGTEAWTHCLGMPQFSPTPPCWHPPRCGHPVPASPWPDPSGGSWRLWGALGRLRRLAGSPVAAGACAGERQQLDHLCFLSARQSSLNQRGMKKDSLLLQPERDSCLMSINVVLKRITLRQ